MRFVAHVLQKMKTESGNQWRKIYAKVTQVTPIRYKITPFVRSISNIRKAERLKISYNTGIWGGSDRRAPSAISRGKSPVHRSGMIGQILHCKWVLGMAACDNFLVVSLLPRHRFFPPMKGIKAAWFIQEATWDSSRSFRDVSSTPRVALPIPIGVTGGSGSISVPRMNISFR